MITEETICNINLIIVIKLDNKDPENIIFGGKIS